MRRESENMLIENPKIPKLENKERDSRDNVTKDTRGPRRHQPVTAPYIRSTPRGRAHIKATSLNLRLSSSTISKLLASIVPPVCIVGLSIVTFVLTTGLLLFPNPAELSRRVFELEEDVDMGGGMGARPRSVDG